MADLKQLALVKFKEGVAVKELIDDMAKLISDMDTVKSFEWGENAGGEETLTQGFTHVFTLTFKTQEDLVAYTSHPRHVEFGGRFAAAIEKILLLHYPPVAAKQ